MLEQNSLDEFMQLAKLSQKNFEGERGKVEIVTGNQLIQGAMNRNQNHASMIGNFLDGDGDTGVSRVAQYQPLTVPRRPAWSKGMSSQEIE